MTDLAYGVRYAPEFPSPVEDDEAPPNPQPVADLETAHNFLTHHATAEAIVVRDVEHGEWRDYQELVT